MRSPASISVGLCGWLLCSHDSSVDALPVFLQRGWPLSDLGPWGWLCQVWYRLSSAPTTAGLIKTHYLVG